MHLWQLEALFVAMILSTTAFFSGGKLTDWIGAAAVLFTFMHGQISFDFQEAQETLENPQVACYKWSGRYFVIKEMLWIVTFVLLRAWPLLVGTVIFATYPRWRKWLRARITQNTAAD
ncbi:MAG TPA: hypothetical protein V6D22_24810 [Candidatus Obscuribacterales bacterium]